MSEDDALEGALVSREAAILGDYIRTRTVEPAQQPADIRYEDEGRDKVTRVLVRVEYADGRGKEYEAREPAGFRISDPEQVSTMAFRTTGLSIGSGGGFRGLQAAVPTLSLSFAANPRYNLHIRNVRADLPQVSMSPATTSAETNENDS